MFNQLITIEQFNKAGVQNQAALFYFSHDECNVCKVLKPKLAEVIKEEFPQIIPYYINIKSSPEISSQHSVFTVPTVIVYLGGKEFFRKSRNINFAEFCEEIARPYSMMFD